MLSARAAAGYPRGMTQGVDTWSLSSRPLRAPGGRPAAPDRRARRDNPLPSLETAALRFEERAAEATAPPAGPAWHERSALRGLLMVIVWVAVVLGWQTPFALPIRLLTVVFHELGHAAACVATGGSVHAIVVHPDGSGLALTQGGAQVAVLNGGYLGSMLCGLGLLRLLKVQGGGHLAAALLGSTLVLVALTWLPLSMLGYSLVLLGGVCLLGLAARSPPALAEWVMRLIGWMCTFYAAVDLFGDVFGGAGLTTDADLLEARTGVAAAAWGGMWMASGAFILWLYRRWLI